MLTATDHALPESSRPNAGVIDERLEARRCTIRRDIVFIRDRLHAPVAFNPRQHAFGTRVARIRT
jgi:hypothetical protein